MANYEWKVVQYKVDPQKAGELLEDINKREGGIRPKTVVDESRPEDALLHGCFEWQDDVAGELYREVQAKSIIRNLIIIPEAKGDEQKKIRAFVHIKNEENRARYLPLDTVVKDGSMRQQMLKLAWDELKAFRRKYQDLSELSKVFEIVDREVDIYETRGSI